MKVDYKYIVILILWTYNVAFANGDNNACDSPIWCHGDLLHSVQTSGLFEDSKTFVDMNLKTDPDTVLRAFQRLQQAGQPNKTSVKFFLDQYFEGPGLELVQWTPSDYKENPEFLERIKDDTLRQFGKDMCKIWSHLGRKINKEVKHHPDRYSMIYLDNPFIVPGGRFREIYYWDSYWVVKGLLVCEMYDTVKGILENFVSFIKRYGLVPNGGRQYYTKRSQPPLLIPMVKLYIERTGDQRFLRDNLRYLVQEYEFWNTNRSVMVPGKNFTLYRYHVETNHARPESYLEDLNTSTLKDIIGVNNNELFSDLASAAESGWDFSSRWLSGDHLDNTNRIQWLAYTRTSDILPVDLNSILCWNEEILSDFHEQLGNTTGAEYFRLRHNTTRSRVRDTFWSEEDGVWYDFSIRHGKHRKQFYPSNLFPLFVGCYDKSQKSYVDTKIVKYLKRSGVLEHISGVPTSTCNTGQQWDLPNAWPPLQDVVISALGTSHLEEGRKLALRLTSQWITSNLIGYQQHDAMFEKYVVNSQGSRGEGGEYNVQEGFGWTNGLVLDLLERFGQNLTVFSYQHDGLESRATTFTVTIPMVTCAIVMLGLL